jgi:uncharacterized protein (DUF433 family)
MDSLAVPTPAPDDVRFSQPLYSMREAAVYLGLPPSTFSRWVKGNGHRGLILAVEGAGPKSETIPFAGLAQGAVVAAFRRIERLPLKYIRAALEVLDTELGIEQALASNKLYLHGGQLLYDHASDVGGEKVLAEILTKNLTFNAVVEGGLKLITYGADTYAQRVRLPASSVVEADPYRGSGKPITLHGGIRAVDIMDRFRGGEAPSYIAETFKVPEEDVIDIIRGLYSAWEKDAAA